MVSFSTLHGKSVFRCNDCRNNFYQGKLPSLPVLQEKGAFIVAPPANLIFAQPWGSSISAPGDRNDTILSVSILQCTVFIRCQTEMRDIGCISFYLDEKLRILPRDRQVPATILLLNVLNHKSLPLIVGYGFSHSPLLNQAVEARIIPNLLFNRAALIRLIDTSEVDRRCPCLYASIKLRTFVLNSWT